MRIYLKPLSLLLILSLFNLTGCVGTTPYRMNNFFITDSINKLEQTKIAVLPFENLTANKQAGLSVTDEFNLQLGKLGKFDLVERIRIDELFKEQDLPKDRIDEATAVKIGKMLGAQAVVLGVITKYKSREQEEQIAQSQQSTTIPVIIENKSCSKKEDKEEGDWLSALLVTGMIITIVGGIVYISFLQPSAEVGISVRMIDVETGQQLWQARDTFKGNRPSIKSLVTTKEERKRLRKDIDFLSRLLCQELAETLK